MFDPQECNVHFGSLFSDVMGMCAPLWILRRCQSIPVHGQRVMLFMGIACFFFIASIPFVCIDPELVTDRLWLHEDLSLDDVLTSFLSLLVDADVVCVCSHPLFLQHMHLLHPVRPVCSGINPGQCDCLMEVVVTHWLLSNGNHVCLVSHICVTNSTPKAQKKIDHHHLCFLIQVSNR